MHKHKCWDCLLVWEHRNVLAIDCPVEGSHDCPGCGLDIRTWYQGGDPANVSLLVTRLAYRPKSKRKKPRKRKKAKREHNR